MNAAHRGQKTLTALLPNHSLTSDVILARLTSIAQIGRRRVRGVAIDLAACVGHHVRIQKLALAGDHVVLEISHYRNVEMSRSDEGLID